MLFDRVIGVICLGGIAVTHLSDLSEKIEEVSYTAVLFCGPSSPPPALESCWPVVVAQLWGDRPNAGI
jgi:hypothetical protein